LHGQGQVRAIDVSLSDASDSTMSAEDPHTETL